MITILSQHFCFSPLPHFPARPRLPLTSLTCIHSLDCHSCTLSSPSATVFKSQYHIHFLLVVLFFSCKTFQCFPKPYPDPDPNPSLVRWSQDSDLPGSLSGILTTIPRLSCPATPTCLLPSTSPGFLLPGQLTSLPFLTTLSHPAPVRGSVFHPGSSRPCWRAASSSLQQGIPATSLLYLNNCGCRNPDTGRMLYI